MMQRLAVLFLSAGLVASEEAVVTPAQKIIQLLNSMKLKGQNEMNEEKIQFGKYNEWCKITLASKQKDIEQGADQIAVSNAEIKKSSADATRLQGEISEHEADLSTTTAEKQNATDVRKMERAEFEKVFLDYSESVDALSRAIKVLKAQNYAREQAASKKEEPKLLQTTSETQSLGARASALLELMSAKDSSKKSKAVADFLALVQKPGVAHAYEFQSMGVIQMLSKLLDEFIVEKKAVEDAEWKKKTSFELLAQSLQIQMDALSSEIAKKQEYKSKALARKAEAEDTLNEASDTKAADEKYHKDLNTECSVKSREFSERQKLRTEEIEAIEKATEILSSDTVAGSAARNLPHDAVKTALAFLRTDRNKKDAAPHDVTPVMNLLKQRASKIHSTALTQLLHSVQAKAQPAANLGALTMIGDMLQELLTKLQTQAEEDTTKKRWCDDEVEQNTLTRSAKTENVDTLNAEIDGLSTSIAQLTEHTAQLTSEVSQLNAAMAEATNLRKADKATNTKTIQESNDAIGALNKALEVLNKFYEKAGDAEALIQVGVKHKVKHAQKPAIFDSTYNGMQGENGGVVGMLQVLLADFERLVAETEVNEETALNEYRDFMEDSKVDASKKKATIEHNEKKKTEQGDALAHRRADLDGNSKELAAAETYWTSLKDKCLNTDADYDTSVERRNEEIQALKDALDMLENL
eukprot:TRINITY_DN1795_c0_g1_i4.p1 TRINITY_DN1795_c0_g1~~TRINITY_DN1795_c0_g1_i4.p1  ORF type:complete len:697 (+),score=213.19 TRINITY_DN1795_c0_g1_i4:87-2177(+)